MFYCVYGYMDNDCGWSEDFNDFFKATTRLREMMKDEEEWGKAVGKDVKFIKAEGGENSIIHYHTEYGYNVGISKFD